MSSSPDVEFQVHNSASREFIEPEKYQHESNPQSKENALSRPASNSRLSIASGSAYDHHREFIEPEKYQHGQNGDDSEGNGFYRKPTQGSMRRRDQDYKRLMASEESSDQDTKEQLEL
jgi:hypothetical protein